MENQESSVWLAAFIFLHQMLNKMMWPLHSLQRVPSFRGTIMTQVLKSLLSEEREPHCSFFAVVINHLSYLVPGTLKNNSRYIVGP